ncbi:hypothetical protein C8R44DRAFT_987786 [Mycena epipterygia]|nr:hypothetical protein C8R44DRAFT_987786 [Mycena epipterygia]
MTSNNIAIVQSALFGTCDSGTYFNDLEVHGGSANVTIDTKKPIKCIHFACGDVIDGLTVTYNVGTTSVDETHGTKPTSKDTVWFPAKNTALEDTKETIVAISGQQGNSKEWGNRIVSLSFTTFSTATGKMKVYGPYGGTNPSVVGTPFRVTANGIFLAFGGYATNTNDGLQVLQNENATGGLYGLNFSDVAYRTV